MQSALNELVARAADVFDVPVAVLSQSRGNHQTAQASFGVGTAGIDAILALSHQAATTGSMLVVPDLRDRAEVASSDSSTDTTPVRFVVMTPLKGVLGRCIGTLCVADYEPHAGITREQRAMLVDLAASISEQLPLDWCVESNHQIERYFQYMALGVPGAIIGTNEHGQVEFWNSAAEQLFGYARHEMLQQHLKRVMPPELQYCRAARIDNIVRSRPADEAVIKQVETEARHRDGSRLLVNLSWLAWAESGRTRFGFIVHSLSEHSSATAPMAHMIRRDPVTGLPTRDSLFSDIEDTVHDCESGTLILIDLVDFARVNQMHGYSEGDRILRQAGQLISQCLSTLDTVVRWGSDEFCVFLAGAIDADQLVALCHRFSSQLRQIDKRPGQLNANMGVACVPKDAKDAEALLAHADFALCTAKRDNRLVSLFDDQMHRHAILQQRYEVQLHDALNCNEFEVFYQPQFRVSDGRVIGAEALLRWHHPQDGLVQPGDFLTTLENSSLAIPVGDWILRTACAQASQWRAAHDCDFTIAVNLFGMQLEMEDFEATIWDALTTTQLSPDALELEITEDIILDDDAIVIDALQRLLDSGVGIAFDDYGTGYASLSMLTRYPLSRLKIDRSFVQQLESSAAHRSVVQTVLSLGTNFDLGVIAEGVETREQLEQLRQSGCREAQGYLVGKPLPAECFANRYFGTANA